MDGTPIKGILELIKSPKLPPSIIKYFFCSPNMDGQFRCMPSSGGLYAQRYRDFLEFNLIEQRLTNIKTRKPKREN